MHKATFHKTIEELDDLYREAWHIARRVPSGLSTGYQTAWPEMIYDKREQQRRAEKVTLYQPPSPQQVEQMINCINWLVRLNDSQRKLIWLRASGLSWRKISFKTGIPHTTVQRHWHKAMLKVQIYSASGV